MDPIVIKMFAQSLNQTSGGPGATSNVIQLLALPKVNGVGANDNLFAGGNGNASCALQGAADSVFTSLKGGKKYRVTIEEDEEAAE